MRSFFIIFGLKGQLISAQWQRLGKILMLQILACALKGQLENAIKLPFQGAGRPPDPLTQRDTSFALG